MMMAKSVRLTPFVLIVKALMFAIVMSDSFPEEKQLVKMLTNVGHRNWSQLLCRNS